MSVTVQLSITRGVSISYVLLSPREVGQPYLLALDAKAWPTVCLNTSIGHCHLN